MKIGNVKGWMIKWAFPAALVGVSGYYGINKSCIDPLKKGSPTHKIQPPPGNKMYHGSWNNHAVDLPHLLCLEEKHGEKFDIALRFINFRELQTAHPFPKPEAETMENRGGSIFLALEPWKGRGFPDLLDKIIKGEFDAELEAFSKGAARYNGPVFVSFAPEMNSGNYPWAGKPELFAEAYRHVHKMISKFAPNITWVWNPYLGKDADRYFPGSEYIDWIAVNFFHHSGESIPKLKADLGRALLELKKHGKPVMIGRFGSSGTSVEKAQFFEQVMKNFGGWGIKGFIYFNHSDTRADGSFISFALREEAEVQSYRNALKKLDLDGNVVTRNGELSSLIPRITPDNCPAIEKKFWDAGDMRHIEELKSFIRNREYHIDRGTDSHENNNLRLQAAKAYRQLSRLSPFKKEKDHFNGKAIRHLKKALRSPDKTIQYHPKIQYVREYAEILLELADIYLEAGKDRRFNALLGQMESDLSNRWTMLAHSISPDSVPGYQNRGNLMRAQYHERRGETKKAHQLYVEVDRWASREQGLNVLTLKWRGEERGKVRFIAVKAKLGQIRILLQDLSRDPQNRTQIMKKLGQIFNWEEAGVEKDGFMDLGFESLVYAMWASMESAKSLTEARANFRSALPWSRINTYPELKTALGVKELDLESGKYDLWDLTLRGLNLQNRIEPHLKELLRQLQIFSEISAKK